MVLVLPTPISEVTPISTLGNNSTPTVTVSINNVGTLTTNRPEGFINGPSIDITSTGNHNVTFASLPDGTYSDVKLTITYANTNYDELILTTFEIITTFPTMTITSSTVNSGSASKDESIELIFTPNELTTNFKLDDITVSGGLLSLFSEVNSSITLLGTEINGSSYNGHFGSDVELSGDGNTIIVGSINANSSKGEAKVLRWTGGVWSPKGSVIQDWNNSNDYSGKTVAINYDGTIIAVGAYGASAGAGEVKMYQWDGSDWQIMGNSIQGKASGDEMTHYHGLSLNNDNINGTPRVALGATNNDANGINNTGNVRVYQWDNNTSTWSKMGADIDGHLANDYYGWSVDLNNDGTRIAIGAKGDDNGNVSNTGGVHVYEYSNGSWTQMGPTIYGSSSNEQFGESVSLNGDGTIVACGAPNSDLITGKTNTGHVGIYQFNAASNEWVQMGVNIIGEDNNDKVGYDVSLNGSGLKAVVLSVGDDGSNNSTGEIGCTRLYHWDGSAWILKHEERGEQADGSGDSGSISISSDGHIFATGYEKNDRGSSNNANYGSVRVHISEALYYTVTLTPIAIGACSIRVKEDEFSNTNGIMNIASNIFHWYHDSSNPSMIITAPDPNVTNGSTIHEATFKIIFTLSEDAINFVKEHIILKNCTLSKFFSKNSMVYTATVTAIGYGLCVIDVPAGVLIDSAGNSNISAARFNWIYSIIPPSQSGRNGFLSKTSVSLNGILYSKNASPFKTNTVPQGSDFSLNRFQFRKNVSTASKGIDASTRTQMLRIKAQKPSSTATNVAQSYKNVKTSYKDARFALSRVRR